MIDFIIWDENETYKNKIENDIYKFFGSKEDEFRIYNYKKYNKKSENNKIYILSSSTFENTISIANNIRNKGDFTSIIIIISNLKGKNLTNDLLILSYIDINRRSSNEIMKALAKSYNIIISSGTFNFIFNKIVYRIPLKDILYIEKELNSNISIIHTKNNDYETHCSIREIERSIKCIKFLRTHRSCIVNLDSIERYDYFDNIIYFKNTSTNLIAKDKKNFLKELLLSGDESQPK